MMAPVALKINLEKVVQLVIWKRNSLPVLAVGQLATEAEACDPDCSFVLPVAFNNRTKEIARDSSSIWAILQIFTTSSPLFPSLLPRLAWVGNLAWMHTCFWHWKSQQSSFSPTYFPFKYFGSEIVDDKKWDRVTQTAVTLYKFLLSDLLHLQSLTCLYDVIHLELLSPRWNPRPQVLWQPPELHRFSLSPCDLCMAGDRWRGRKVGAQRAFLLWPLCLAAAPWLGDERFARQLDFSQV